MSIRIRTFSHPTFVHSPHINNHLGYDVMLVWYIPVSIYTHTSTPPVSSTNTDRYTSNFSFENVDKFSISYVNVCLCLLLTFNVLNTHNIAIDVQDMDLENDDTPPFNINICCRYISFINNVTKL